MVKPLVQSEKAISTTNGKLLPANESCGSVQCGPPMADVKDPYS